MQITERNNKFAEWHTEKKTEVAGTVLAISAEAVGRDILLRIKGGTRPHLGSVVQSVPRPSLAGDGTVSATSSVLNLCGHKDEYLCRALAEKVCRALQTTVVATGGFHLDGITPEQIRAVLAAADRLGEEIISDYLQR